MKRSAALGGMRSVRLDLRRAPPPRPAAQRRSCACRTRWVIQYRSPGSGSPCARSSRYARVAPAPSPRDEQVGQRPDLALGRVRARALDLVDPELRARAELERELLELAQQALLAVADVRDERLRRGAVELEAEPARLLAHPLRQLPGLDGALGADVAAGRLDRRRAARRRLGAALLAGEEGDGRLGRHRPRAPGARCACDLGVLPALDAVDDEEAPPDGEGHRAQRRGDRVRRRRVALEDLDAARARSRSRPARAAARALGDTAVVVAVDEVGGLEGRHGGESTPAAAPSIGRLTQASRPGAVTLSSARAVAVRARDRDAGAAGSRSVGGLGWP